MKTTAVALLLSLSLAAGVPAYASEATLQRQLDAQQKTILEMQSLITELSSQVNTLRADVESLRFELAKSAGGAVSAAPATVQAPVTQPAAPGSATATGPAPVKETASAAAAQGLSAAAGGALALKAVDSSAQSAYDAAYAKVVSNDLKGAATAFNGYVTTYPDNTLTPNAWYWLGQVQYKLNDLDNARVSFLNVARFTSSTKRPDALYKLGLISKMRGEKDKAEAYFNLVIRTYPADTSSDLARRELSQQG